MSVTRIVVIVGAAFYLLLWVLAANGVSSLVAPLAVPLVLAVLVALGVALNRFLGIAPRRQHFQEHDDETEK
jgi:VIT1/CCC1 family predicted Fe2+/Mn2+ transporter